MNSREFCDLFEQYWKQAVAAESTGVRIPDLKRYVDAKQIDDEQTLNRLIELDQWYREKINAPASDGYYQTLSAIEESLAATKVAAEIEAPEQDPGPQSVRQAREMPPLRCPRCGKYSLTVTHEADSFRCCDETCESSFELKPSDEPVLARVSHYEIIGLLGQGGFGRVWLAKDKLQPGYVALKIPRQRLSDEMADRFLKEIKADYKILNDRRSADRIPPLYDAGRDGDISYIAFKFLNAAPLSDVAGKRKLPPKEAAEIVLELARTLQIAHDNHIIHRDIKPANVLINHDNGHPLLIDFGIAKIRDVNLQSELETNSFIGTLSYASPEQSDGKMVDERSDIFSLGIVLFELLAGQRPFEASDNLATYIQIADLANPAPQISEYVPGISPELERTVSKCLNKNKAERYRSAGELADDLAAFLGHAPQSLQHNQHRPVGFHPSTLNESSSTKGSLNWIAIMITAMALLAIGLVLALQTGWFSNNLWLAGNSTTSNDESLDRDSTETSDVSPAGSDSNQQLWTLSSLPDDKFHAVLLGKTVTDATIQSLFEEYGDAIAQITLNNCKMVTLEGIKEISSHKEVRLVRLVKMGIPLSDESGKRGLSFADMSKGLDANEQRHQPFSMEISATCPPDYNPQWHSQKICNCLGNLKYETLYISSARSDRDYQLLCVRGAHPFSFDDAQFKSFVERFQDNSEIDELWLFETEIRDEGLSSIEDWFPNLTYLRMDYTDLRATDDLESNLTKLSIPPTLEKIVMPHCGLTDRDLEFLVLPQKTVGLSLWNDGKSRESIKNVISGSGLKKLAENNKQLESITLERLQGFDYSNLRYLLELQNLATLNLGEKIPEDEQSRPEIEPRAFQILWQLARPQMSPTERTSTEVKIGAIPLELARQIPDEDIQTMVAEVCSPKGFSEGRANIVVALGEVTLSSLEGIRTDANRTDKEKANAEKLTKKIVAHAPADVPK